MTQVHICQCPTCHDGSAHPDVARHRQINVFANRLNEQQRRWFVALESERIGHGGDRLLSQITGMDEQTIRRGRRELASELVERPEDRIRLPGGGRPPLEKKIRSS